MMIFVYSDKFVFGSVMSCWYSSWSDVVDCVEKTDGISVAGRLYYSGWRY